MYSRKAFVYILIYIYMGFPHSSVGKESACNAGDPGSISGSGRSTGEGIGYPLQHSWASLVTQLVKNPPAVWETWVRSLGWESPLEESMAIHSSILAWRILWTEEPGGLSPWGLKEPDMTERLLRSTSEVSKNQARYQLQEDSKVYVKRL